MHPLVALMRRFTLDWLGRADPSVCAEIMSPGYTVHIGGATLFGLDEYVPATLAQLRRFPGLLVTVHELVTDGRRVAMHFTEHGPSAAHDGRPSAWAGIGLWEWNGSRLTRNVTEEDYQSRRRQLADDRCDAVTAPAAAPWAALPVAGDPVAEQAVREWLTAGDLSGLGVDDSGPLLDDSRVEITELFSAGRHVAWQAVQTGRYRGGLPDTDGAQGREASIGLVGLVHVAADGVVTGPVVRDRVGLRRAVRKGCVP